jgi:hypothetical protein
MSDLTTKVLIQIRDQIQGTNERLEQTNARLEEVAQRQVESEMRVATELVAVRHSVDHLADLFRADRSLRSDVDDLKSRVANLERKTG